MRNTVLLLSVTFIWSSAICFAAEPSKPKVNLNQRASDAVKDIGDNMNKAGAAIKKSVDNAGKKINQAGSKPSSKSSKPGKSDAGKPDVGERLQTGAKDALKKVEAEADKAEPVE